jgi:hypothetical protein
MTVLCVSITHYSCAPFESDAPLIFQQVENKLFRVSTRWLEANSSKYSKIRRSSVINSVDQPLTLPDVSIAELETLLDFIDERCVLVVYITNSRQTSALV